MDGPFEMNRLKLEGQILCSEWIPMRQIDARETGSKATWPKWSLRNLI